MAVSLSQVGEVLSLPYPWGHFPYRWRWVTPKGRAMEWNPGWEKPLLGNDWERWTIEAVLFNGQKVRYKAPSGASQPIPCETP